MVFGPGQTTAVSEGQDDQQQDEQSLIVMAKTGRAEAREELARRFRQPAYLLALQLVGNREDALDIAQDSMLRFFESLGRFRPDRPIRPWIFTIVRNRARDLWRRRSTRPSESLELRPALVAQLAHSTPDPEQAAVGRERQSQVWKAIAALSERHREIIVLRDFHDLAYAEIAAVLEIPAGTVMSRLHSARGSLRKLLIDGERHA